MTTVCPNVHRDDRERQSAPGLRVCFSCRSRLDRAITEAPALDTALQLALVRADQAGGDPVTHRRDPGLVLSQHALEARSAIRQQLVAQVRMVIEERGLADIPSDTVAAMSVWLVRHVDWLCAHEAAEVWCSEWSRLQSQCRRAAYPSGVRRIDLGICPDDECEADLMALIRRDGDLLPSVVRCAAEEPHVWEAHEWQALGRRLYASGYFELVQRAGSSC